MHARLRARSIFAIAIWGAFGAACSGGHSAAHGDAGGGMGTGTDTMAGGNAAPAKNDAGSVTSGAGGSTAASSGGAGSAGGAAGSGTGGTPSAAGAGGRTSDAALEPKAAGAPEDAATPAECGHCTTYATPMKTGTVEPSELDALSGLATSRAQPEIVFTHNDHDRPVVYALDLQGHQHLRITLENAPSSDIEDIAVGPCGAQTCVYLGDIGDNSAQRSEYAILRFLQPSVPDTAGTTAMTVTFERFRFTYDDGSHNAESLLVAPDGTLYVITKLAPGSGGKVTATGPSSVYRLPASLSTTTVAHATKVSTLTVPANGEFAASGAAAHPCGAGFLLRTYDKVYEFLTPNGASFEAAFSTTPKVIAMPDEPQSEGIDYRADGRGFVTSGEGAHAPIVLTACAQ
jgi:hypothetical protein